MSHVKGYGQLGISIKTNSCRDGEDAKQFSNLEVSKRREAGRI